MASGKAGESSKMAKVSSGQMSLLSVLKPTQKYEQKSKKWQELTDSVTYCLAKDMMPIYSAEKEGFRQLLQSFDPQYELPSRKYVLLQHCHPQTLHADTRNSCS